MKLQGKAIFLTNKSKNNPTWIEIYALRVSKTRRFCWCVEFSRARLNFALIFRQIDERQDDRWIEPSLMQIKCQNLQMHNINFGSKNLVPEAFKNHNIKLKQRAWKHLSRVAFSKIMFQICGPRNYFTRFSSGRMIHPFSQQICISSVTSWVLFLFSICGFILCRFVQIRFSIRIVSPTAKIWLINGILAKLPM